VCYSHPPKTNNANIFPAESDAALNLPKSSPPKLFNVVQNNFLSESNKAVPAKTSATAFNIKNEFETVSFMLQELNIKDAE
jgi:hypothetical protein